METHYVCAECGFLSKLPGTCQDDLCIKQGMPLVNCHCEDGKHALVRNLEEEDVPGERKDGITTNTLDLDEESPEETV